MADKLNMLFTKQMVATLALLLVCTTASAQFNVLKLAKKVTEFFDSMAVKGIDPRYIEVPEKPWQVVLRGNMNQSIVSMHTEGSIEGTDYSAQPYLKTRPSRYVGLWVAYRGHGVGFTRNVGGDKGSYLTVGAMARAYGYNVRIHTFESSTPRLDLDSDIVPEEHKEKWDAVQLITPIKVRTVFADGYYLFNNKHFSYAAAYKQSVIQKRSAGSLMAGAMFNYTNINYAADSNGDLIFLMHGLGRVKLWQGSLGLGYAYNWVPCKGLLVNVMAMPMLTFVNKLKAYAYETNIPEMMEDPTFLKFVNYEIGYDEYDEWYYKNVKIKYLGSETFNSGASIGFDGRVSLTYNFGRYFLNVFGQFNNIRYHHKSSNGYLNDWFINTSIGVRL